MHRRQFMKHLSGLLALGLVLPKMALAAIWNKPAFETDKLDKALADLGVSQAIKTDQIIIKAPDRAENGAIVQVEVESLIANTQAISILVEKNPTPLIATYDFAEGVAGFIITRIKMADTSDVTVVVKAEDKYFSNAKNVVVLESGCS